jgi:CTP:molybdopterin cytidylyltransferase MocA
MFVTTMKTETGLVSATDRARAAGLETDMEWETGRAASLANAAEAVEEDHKLMLMFSGSNN